MECKQKENIALFRFRVISSLINPEENAGSLSSKLEELSQRTFVNHKGDTVRIGYGTIEKWYYKYRKHGFDALKPKSRDDIGFYRKVDDEIFGRIKYYHDNYPRIPSTMIFEKLKEDGLVTDRTISLSTVTRVINNINSSSKLKPEKEMRRYEREHINEVWCGDTSYGPYVNINGKRVRTYIMAFIDDASRMVLGADLVLNDNFSNMMGTLKKAVVKYGKPNVLNFDNGSSYKNKQMELLAARIGTTLNYCAPYSPQGKAKIERWFRTLKDSWMSNYNKNSGENFEDMRQSLFKFVEEYNNRVHKSLGTSPNHRFFKESSLIIRLSDDLLASAFLLEMERTVSIDNVIVIDNKEYEVDYKYAKKRIRLRYSKDFSEVYVVDDETGELEKIKLLNKVSNSGVKRNKIRFSEVD